jgi:putative membrane protein
MSENMNKTITTNELACERNRPAADRTLMAWLRTALAMIGFGFGLRTFPEKNKLCSAT